ncbi:hypothetical protein [Bradyrhizobium tunisiense]|uniref:hypothetical protein n=1 Tax=Bradyrhizobium tunisiense TaxID=3278709 RepID=UPI0035DDB04F
MQEPLLTNHFSGTTEGDVLVVRPDFDLAAQDQPAAIDALAAAADDFIGNASYDAAKRRPRHGAPDQFRIRTVLLEKPLELRIDAGAKAHLPSPKMAHKARILRFAFALC